MLLTTSLRNMLARRGNVMGTLLAMTLAVAIMLGAILVLLATLAGPGVTARLNATDLVVRPDLAAIFDTPEDSVPLGMSIQIPPEQVEAVRQVDGVERVVGDVTFSAQILLENGTPLTVSDDAVPRGQSWEAAVLTPFHIVDGREPQASNEVVLDIQTANAANVSLGQDVRILTNHSTASYQVVGIADTVGGTQLERQSSVFFAPETALALVNDHDSVDIIAVFIADGADVETMRKDIRAATEGLDLQVLTGPNRAKADATAGSMEVTELGVILGVMSGFVGFVAIFVMMSTIGFSIQQRAREIGLQRAIGYTPRQVRVMILIETLAIAVVGSVLGMLLGPFFARMFIRIGVRFGGVPENFTASFDPLGAVIVVGSALGIAMVAAWLAGRRTARIHPIEALRSASAPRNAIGWRRYIVGLAFAIGGVAAIAMSPSLPSEAAVAMSLLVTALLTIACSALGPRIVVPFARVIGRFARVGEHITGDLAASNARSMAGRVASTMTPVVVGVGFLALMFGFTATLETATTQITDGRERAAIHVVPVGDALPVDVADVLTAIPGVDQVEVVYPFSVTTLADDMSMEAEAAVLNPDTLAVMHDLEFSSGGLEEFVPGTVIISSMLEYSGSTGSTMEVMLSDGTVRQFTVVGEATNLTGLGDILITPEDAAGHLGDTSPSAVNLTVQETADIDVVSSAIDALGIAGYPVTAMSHDQYVSGVQQSMQDGVWATYLIIGAAATFGLVASINTLSMSISERSREFALMRLIGATQEQVRRMLAKEALIVCVIGLALGWGIAILSTTPVSIGMVGDLSAMTIPWIPFVATGVVASAAVFATSLVSGLVALRQVPVAEIGRKD